MGVENSRRGRRLLQGIHLTGRVKSFSFRTVGRNSAFCTLHSALKKRSSAPFFLHNRLVVYNKSEGKTQLFGCLTAHNHSSEENLKVIHHRAVLSVNSKSEGYGFVFLIYLECGLLNGVVYSVVDVKGGLVGISDSASAYVGFIRNDKCRRNG